MKLPNKKGFTLVELLVSITVLVIISTIGYSTYSNAQIGARDGRRKTDLRNVAIALDLYYQTQNPKKYPASAATSGNSTATTPAGWSGLLTGFINEMPNDPGSNTYRYIPISAGASYVLCATLENTKDKDMPANKLPAQSMDSNCPSGTNFYVRGN